MLPIKTLLLLFFHLGYWSPEKDCCFGLTFRQPMWKPSSDSRDSLILQPIYCGYSVYWPMKSLTRVFEFSIDLRLSLDSEGGFRTGCHKQQSISCFQSPRWSFSITVYYSWVQTIFFFFFFFLLLLLVLLSLFVLLLLLILLLLFCVSLYSCFIFKSDTFFEGNIFALQFQFDLR